MLTLHYVVQLRTGRHCRHEQLICLPQFVQMKTVWLVGENDAEFRAVLTHGASPWPVPRTVRRPRNRLVTDPVAGDVIADG